MIEHFIVVRVRDDRRETVGSVRRALHDHAEEYDLNVADIVLSNDAKNTHYGLPVKPYFEAVKEMFEEHMSHAKATAAAWRASEKGQEEAKRMELQEKNPAAQRKKKQAVHRGRTERALKVVRRYETKYGERLNV